MVNLLLLTTVEAHPSTRSEMMVLLIPAELAGS
jgi:hypothetical protein